VPNEKIYMSSNRYYRIVNNQMLNFFLKFLQIFDKESQNLIRNLEFMDPAPGGNLVMDPRDAAMQHCFSAS
jgi:hypothetical protein